MCKDKAIIIGLSEIMYTSFKLIKMSFLGRPNVSGWLEYEHGHTVAVCEAASKQQTSIQWETPWNSSALITQVPETTGQLSTVISRLHLPEHASHRNLTCVVTANNLKHTKTRFSNFTFRGKLSRFYSLHYCYPSEIN